MSRVGLNMKKAIFFDIDGTLIDCINGHIDLSHQVKQAIRRLQQEGHYAFIATGRPYAFLSEAILSFGFDGYILTNGAQVMIGNETIYKEPLDPTFVKNATAEFEQRQIQYMLQSDRYSYMKDEYKYKFQTVTLESFLSALIEEFSETDIFRRFEKRYLDFTRVEQLINDAERYESLKQL